MLDDDAADVFRRVRPFAGDEQPVVELAGPGQVGIVGVGEGRFQGGIPDPGRDDDAAGLR